MVDRADIEKVMKKLTEAQREALQHRQFAMFAPDAVRARGPVCGALRRRGLIEGDQPYARLTDLGQAVVARLEA